MQQSAQPNRVGPRMVEGGSRRVAAFAAASGQSTASAAFTGRAAASTAFLPDPIMLHPQKRRKTALLLCLFFGCFGTHRFYVGKRGSGYLYLLTSGVMGIGVIVDLILILNGSFEDCYGQSLI